MKPHDKRWPETKGAGHTPRGPATPARPTTPARPFKPPVAQAKSAAPSAYRPQAKPPVAQRKAAQPPPAKTPPAAPPAYRPQPTPKVLQTKSATHSPLAPRPQAQTHARREHSCEPKHAPAVPAPNVHQVAQAKRPTTRPHASSDFAPKPFARQPSNVILRSKAVPRPFAHLGGGVIQMKPCPLCSQLPGYDDHTDKNCPYKDDEPPAEEKKAKKPAKDIDPPKKKEEKFHDLGVSKIEVKATPAAGNTLGALANISKFHHPDVYLQTLLNITGAGSPLSLTVGAGKTLKYNKGTTKETKEYKVTLKGPGTANQYVVIHYHPKAAVTTGATSGESIIHVKGEQAAAYKGKYISAATLGELKIPVPAGHT